MRQTRRRLIGAVALVLLVVILLPVVFDKEPAPSAGNDIELRIPNKDSAGEFQPKIDLPELDKMASATAAAPVVASATVATSAPVVLTPAVADKPAAEKTVVPAPAAVNKPRPEVKAEPKTKPAARPKPESKPSAKAAAVPKSGWALQVGAFSNADTAKALQARLSKQGYHAYTEKAGSVVRVRVGGYPTREAAEKVQHKLETQGTHANVVNLE